jgi:hypothetical protein
MIIHSPIISGSLTFAQGATFTLPDNGVYSGSFSGSITGIGDPTTFSASVDTRIDQLAIDTGSQDSRLDNLEGFTSSIDTTIKTKLNTETVISGSSQVVSLLPAGVVSGSSQVSYPSLSNIPSGIVSGSSQITPLLPSGTVSGSSQVVYTSLSSIPSGIVSGSAQIDITLTTGTLDISSRTNLAVSDTSNVDMILTGDTLSANLKGGVVSGSSQIDLTQTTNYSSGIKTRLDAEGVTSGSSHILALVSIDEDTMSSNSDTKLPTQQSVKSYVDTEIAALVSGSPATLDTLNELAAALGDDASFSTTVSNTIAGKVSQSLQIISGNGLTGGGNLTTDRTLNVVGTADRISVSADAVDIASTYVGQSTITTLGTISTGTWNGSVIASAYLDSDTAHLTTTQTFSGAKTFSAITTISNATASTTTTTGALKVTGGVGIGGALNVGGDVVAYASSDERLKNNIELISNPIEKVQQLKGVTWEWNENADELQQSLPNVGVIAQDVEKVLPQLVHDRDNGYKGVDYAKLTGLLIEAIKEQQKQIDELKSRLG